MDFTEFNCPSRPALNAWRESIVNQAHAANVPSCALAAIVSNETGGRNVFQEGVPRGEGCGVGLCQITAGVDWTNLEAPTYHAPDASGKTWALLDPSSNLWVAAEYFLKPAVTELISERTHAQYAFARWSGEILYFAFAAYNMGTAGVIDAVLKGHDPDGYTSDEYAKRAMEAYTAFLVESTQGTK